MQTCETRPKKKTNKTINTKKIFFGKQKILKTFWAKYIKSIKKLIREKIKLLVDSKILNHKTASIYLNASLHSYSCRIQNGRNLQHLRGLLSESVSDCTRAWRRSRRWSTSGRWWGTWFRWWRRGGETSWLSWEPCRQGGRALRDRWTWGFLWKRDLSLHLDNSGLIDRWSIKVINEVG